MVNSEIALQITFGRGFLTLAYFLVPGYISYKAYLYARIREDDFHRFDRLLYTILFGFASLYVSSVVYRLNLWVLVTGSWPFYFSVEKFLNGGMEMTELGDTTVLGFVNRITVQALIGAGIAFIIGKWLVPEDREEFDAKQPYETAMESIDRGEKLRITTMNGAEFEGILHQSGSRKDNSDFLLRRPHKREQSDGKFRRVDVDSDANEDLMYFNYNDISVIHFIDSKLPDLSIDDAGSGRSTNWEAFDEEIAEMAADMKSREELEFVLSKKESNKPEDETDRDQ